VERFTELRDTPPSYEKQGGKFARVSLEEDQIEFVDPPVRTLSVGGGSAGPPGPVGPVGPEGPAGADSVPKSATITRDSRGRIQSVTLEGEETKALARDADGRVSSISDSSTTVDIDRDEAGILTGTTVTEL
jgi:YD repeat-containing protein